MNDIQTKENIYSSSCAAVEKQQHDLAIAQNNTLQMKNMYREAVVHVAIESEKLRRKKDSLVLLIILGAIGIIELILLLINLGVGILVLIGIGVAIYMIKSDNQKDSTNYQNRKEFFMKYQIYDFKWKN